MAIDSPAGKTFSFARVSNLIQYHLHCFKLAGPDYPRWLLRKVVLDRRRVRRDLSGFSGCGLEIGGPSRFFQPGQEFPVYRVARSVDNVNYGKKTFWEGTLEEGKCFRYNPDKDAGQQFICEASDLSSIQDTTYEFVASCHTLEHCANPIKALNEWRRVLKPQGWLALVLPHRAGTFDHRRNVTEMEHLLKDYRLRVTEEDTTHFGEILEKHDLERDPGQKSRADFEKWIVNNFVNRGAHHHVFDPALAITLVDSAGFDVISAEVLMPFHIFILARVTSSSQQEREQNRRRIIQGCCARSPFRSDRKRDFPQSQD